MTAANPGVERRRLTDGRILTATVVMAVIGALPQFLIAALSPLVMHDLQVSMISIAAAVLAQNLVAVSVSPFAGWFIAALGTTRCAAVSLMFTAVGLLCMASTPTAFVHQLWLSMALLGVPLALAHPVSNQLLLGALSPERRGVAFGLKQGAIPLAGLVAGLCAPLAVEVATWRACVVGVALATAIAGALVLPTLEAGRQSAGNRRQGPERAASTSTKSLLVVTVTSCFASAACVATSVHLVSLAVSRGYGVPAAGLILAATSSSAIVGRIGFGALTDRFRVDPLRLAAFAMLGGAAAMAMMPIARGELFLAVAAVLGATAWSWNGSLHLSVAVRHGARAAWATGIAQVGIMLGAGVGPLLFARGLAEASTRSVWIVGASVLGASGVALFLAAPGRGHDATPVHEGASADDSAP